MLIAVYGTLRKGEFNNYLLTDGELLGTEFVVGKYRMIDLGGYPAIFHDEYMNYPIVVEVYDVDEYVLSDLDRLEGYPNYYDRELVKTKHGDAWIYYLTNVQDIPRPVMPFGDWVGYKQERNALHGHD